MANIKIGDCEFNTIIDDSVPLGTVIFQDPRTSEEVGRIVNISTEEDPLNTLLTGAYEATKAMSDAQ